jgi:hypothetical protein
VDSYTEGLRCQDVNMGLRNFDATSPSLATVRRTRQVGMAADLAALVRERDLISDMDALETVAAAELDIPPTSFDSVLQLLESSGLVELTRVGARVTGLTSEVPSFRDLYPLLGETWRDQGPSQLEEEVVAVVDRLAHGPVPAESLVTVTGIETADLAAVLDLGTQTELIQRVTGVEGDILYSPFTSFENPALLSQLAEQHGSDRLLEEFAALRARQGLPVSPDRHPLLYDALGRGLLLAPSVELPGGGQQPFATLPYTLDRELLIGEKPVLDKALAIVACVRCGEDFGGFSSLPDPVAAVNKLLREGELNPHSSHERQYRLLQHKGIIAFGPDPMPGGRWVVPQLIDTSDNRKALEIARDLLLTGESMTGRTPEGASALLAAKRPVSHPAQDGQADEAPAWTGRRSAVQAGCGRDGLWDDMSERTPEGVHLPDAPPAGADPAVAPSSARPGRGGRRRA